MFLLGFTGVGGENTDVIAHLTGLVSGLGLGVVAASLRMPPPGRAGRSRACGGSRTTAG